MLSKIGLDSLKFSQKKILVIIAIVLSLVNQNLFSQRLKDTCPNNITYFAYNLPINDVNWYVPIKYDITEGLIDLKIRHESKDELFIRFKIIENLQCDFKDIGNCDLKYIVLTYDEESETYGERKSEIVFSFSNGKGKIYIQHPNFPQILSDATIVP